MGGGRGGIGVGGGRGGWVGGEGWGVYFFHLVRLPICPSVDRIVSALYLLQYSPDPFYIYTSYQVTSEGSSRGKGFCFKIEKNEVLGNSLNFYL